MYLSNKAQVESFISSHDKCVIKFGATWCHPCKTQDDIIEQLDGSYPIAKIDIDESSNLMNIEPKFPIRAVPTIFFYKAGKLVKNKVGVASKFEIERFFKEN